MPSFTITISATAATRLRGIVDRSNADKGASLTVTEWLTLHVKEMAIQEELQAAAARIQREAETNANAALLAERDRLTRAL